MCRSLGNGPDGYNDGSLQARSHEHHHHDPYHRHPSPQDMGGPRGHGGPQAPDMYRDLPPLMPHAPHHHHHHHHHHPQHPHHLVRHSSNIDRHTLERHRASLESRGVLEPHQEVVSPRDPLGPLLLETRPQQQLQTGSSAPDMLRHHRSVPDMYATLQAEERAAEDQHTYGEGCRLRRQQSISKEGTTSTSGSAASEPTARPRSRPFGLQRQHSLGQELSRPFSKTLDFRYGRDLRSMQQDITRSQSNALDLARAGSLGGLAPIPADIRRSRSNAQEMCRGARAGSEGREIRHAHSTHEISISHSPRSRSPRSHQTLPDVYPEPPRASSGGSSGPSPPIPSGPPSEPPRGQSGGQSGVDFPRQHSSYCEVARAAQQQQQQQQQQQHGFCHMKVPPPASRVSQVAGNHTLQPFHHHHHHHTHHTANQLTTTTTTTTTHANNTTSRQPLRNGRLKVSLVLIILSLSLEY
ncbi:uncharacterized protein [Macrobrachium rosenbergii]|uniref:uncharacterized protein n=1 Tax=Macrobrachium rosenbergii TaxID=79674 RepID=UPI0034D5692E